MSGEAPAWERIQIKTFTKWCNQHLKKEFGPEAQIEDIVKDWQDGILLIKLAVAIYKTNEKNPEQAIAMPKLKPMELSAKSRISQIQNCNRAISLFKQAGLKLTIGAENLVDGEKIPILGMIWQIILDYAARGFGGSASEVKRALLDWVNKKTDGYERVNPPGVKNFTKDWRSGLAWCALIHAHRPEMIDYAKCLESSNAENLETAFSVADEQLGIPRLLDVEDVDTEDPDDKSVMTYVMEYFHRFASEQQRDAAAKQAAEWLALLRSIGDMEHDYERRAKLLMEFGEESKAGWASFEFGESLADAKASFAALREFVTITKPPQEAEKMDLEVLFLRIQTIRHVNNLNAYVPPAGLESEALEDHFNEMVACQNAHGKSVRQNSTKFIEKKDDSVGEEIIEKIEASFTHYDHDSSGQMNKTEFEAACMEMGVVLKTQEEKDELFHKVAVDDDHIDKQEYISWMMGRLVHSLDDPEGIKAAFKAMAGDATSLPESALGPPLSPEDIAYIKENFPKNDDGTYDYATLVDGSMGRKS